MILKLISTLLLSYSLAAMLMPGLRKLAAWFDLTDKPNIARKIHKAPVPLVGGIVIGIASMLTLPMALDFGLYNNFGLMPIMVGATILMVTGIIDDKLEINPFKKLLIQFCCAYLIVESDFVLDHFLDELHLYILPYSIKKMITMVFIVAVVNAYNLMDGIDGLAGTLFSVVFIWLTFAGIVMEQWALSMVSVSVVGGLFAFLKYNFDEKNKVFLGDSGSLFLSFILVTCSIYVMDNIGFNHHKSMVSGIMAMIALPLLDALRVFAGRIKKGKSPFFADKSHIHHVLLSIQSEHKKVAFILLALSILIVITALVMAYFYSLLVIAFWVLMVFSGLMNLIGMIDGMHKHRAILAKQEMAR